MNENKTKSIFLDVIALIYNDELQIWTKHRFVMRISNVIFQIGFLHDIMLIIFSGI